MSQTLTERDQREFPKHRNQRRKRCSVCNQLTYSMMSVFNDGRPDGIRCYECRDKYPNPTWEEGAGA